MKNMSKKGGLWNSLGFIKTQRQIMRYFANIALKMDAKTPLQSVSSDN